MINDEYFSCQQMIKLGNVTYRTRTAFVSAARTAAQYLLLCNKTHNDVLSIASVLSLSG